MRLALSKSYRYLKNFPSVDSAQMIDQRTKQRIFTYPTDFKKEIIRILGGNSGNHYTRTSSSLTKNTKEIEKNNALKALHLDISTCDKCFLGKSRGNHLALPTQKSPSQTKIIVIVDNVSYYDQMREQYFVDEAGSMIKRILEALKIPMAAVYATAAIKCTQVVEFGDRLQETTPCLTHLRKEISLLSPELIIAFGEITYQILKEEIKEENDEFEAIRGKIMHFLGKKIIFTYHPRKIMRNPSLKKEVWNNLKPLAGSISIN